MKTVTTLDSTGKIIEVEVTDEVYAYLEQARKSDETRARYDRSALTKDELSDAHSLTAFQPDELVSDTVERTILIEEMLSAVGRLSDYEQLLIKKRFYDNLTYTAIAQEIGQTPQAVRQRINRVISRLAEEFQG